tara:strand:+ start:71577 stop:72956 length:1380 start_codon:yes stop_codon:yes gene_type:complete
MKYAVITIGRSGSSELINILNKLNIDVIPKPSNHLYPNQLKQKFGLEIKVIFLIRNIPDVIYSIKNRELDYGKKWIKNHYNNLNVPQNFSSHDQIFEKDTLELTKLCFSYLHNQFYDVLFLKYEDLFYNNEKTINKLSEFIGTPIIVPYNKKNKWRGSIKPENRVDNNIDKIYKSYEKLINFYNSFEIKLVNRVDNLINRIILLKSNKDYRLGNLILEIGIHNIREQSINNIIKNKDYDGSILKNFLINLGNGTISNKNEKLKFLLQQVQNYTKNNNLKKPLTNELVVHLRLGDVAKFSKKFLSDKLKDKIFNYLEKYDKIKKVTFCTAYHYGDRDDGVYSFDDDVHKINKSKLRFFLNDILNKFPNTVFDIKSNSNIDIDFCYMINATHFIQDFGTFTSLIKKIINFKKELNIKAKNFKKVINAKKARNAKKAKNVKKAKFNNKLQKKRFKLKKGIKK